MWLCKHCGETIDVGEFNWEKQQLGECHGAPAYEDVSSCPHCGGYDIVDAVRCRGCGWIYEEGMLDDDDLCADCQKHEKSYKSNYKKEGEAK